jgi:hypothetical protein
MDGDGGRNRVREESRLARALPTTQVGILVVTIAMRPLSGPLAKGLAASTRSAAVKEPSESVPVSVEPSVSAPGPTMETSEICP